MTSPAHAPNGPSSLRRRALCPGSYAAELPLPGTTGDDAERGTLLHAITARLVMQDDFAVNHETGLSGDIEFDDLPEYDQWAVKQCIKTFRAARVLMTGSFKTETERKIDVSFIHETISHGTADIAIYEDFGRGIVIDWKFGIRAHPVAAQNMQLAAYCLGLAREHNLDRVTGIIFQPICGMPITKEESIRHAAESDLRYFKATGRYSVPLYVEGAKASEGGLTRVEYTSADWMTLQHDLQAIVENAIASNAPRIPSEEACRYCKASGQCPAQAGKVTAIERAKPQELTASKLAEYLNIAPEVETWIKGLKAHAYAVLAAGGTIPGYALVPGREGNRKWAAGAEAALAELAATKGKTAIDIYEPRALKSPAAMDKVFGTSKAVRERLEPLIERTPAGLKMERVG